MKGIVLALVLGASVMRGDIVFNHAAQGALLSGAAVHLLGGSLEETWVAFGAGAVLGVLPDVAGVVGGSQRGDFRVYATWHSMQCPLLFLPPVTLHLLVDAVYHSPQGGWRPGMVPVVICTIVVEVILIYLFAKWVER